LQGLCLSPRLCIGTTLPETQSKDRVPVDSDLLNNLQRGTQIKSAATFNKKGVMLSGPQALLILSQHSSL